MKKFLAVFMAVLMTFGVCAFGASAKDPVETCTYAEAVEAATKLGSVLLVFDFGSCEAGTVPAMTNSYWKQISSGEREGCYVLYGSSYAPELIGKLPGIRNAPEGYVAGWVVNGGAGLPGTCNEEDGSKTPYPGYVGVSIPSAGNYQIPSGSETGKEILFTVQLTINKRESVLTKILAIFAKILAAIFNDDSISDMIMGLLG